MMDMAPTPFAHVQRASMDEIAPMKSSTVPQPNVETEVHVLKDMVEVLVVVVLWGSLGVIVTLNFRSVPQLHV